MLRVPGQRRSRAGTQVQVLPNTVQTPAPLSRPLENRSDISRCSLNRCSNSTPKRELTPSSPVPAPAPSNQLLLPNVILTPSSASPFSAPTASRSACHQSSFLISQFQGCPCFPVPWSLLRGPCPLPHSWIPPSGPPGLSWVCPEHLHAHWCKRKPQNGASDSNSSAPWCTECLMSASTYLCSRQGGGHAAR